jgi:hypothetical protein
MTIHASLACGHAAAQTHALIQLAAQCPCVM